MRERERERLYVRTVGTGIVGSTLINRSLVELFGRQELWRSKIQANLPTYIVDGHQISTPYHSSPFLSVAQSLTSVLQMSRILECMSWALFCSIR